MIAQKLLSMIITGIIIVSAVHLIGCTQKHESENHSIKHETVQNKKELYRCSMHPAVTSDKPGICPICHMDLEKVEEDTSKPVASTSDVQSVEGRGSFSLSQERQQMIGVTTAQVVTRHLGYEVRASGRVAFDPELFTAIEEYRQAVMSRGQMTDTLMQNQANDLISSAKTKLKLMGLSDDQIRKLVSQKTNAMDLLLPSGSVWVYAEVFEYEVAGLKSGLAVEVETPSLPGKLFTGKLSSINPVVNSPTRTVRVRALIPDPESLLRPETFVNVKIKIDLGEKLAIPESAVLFSGEQKFVFVVKEQGHFSPRAIQAGLKAEGFYEVISGLQVDETIVTSANFLIDSESRLRGVLENATQTPVPSHGGH
ncbi:MAG: efflux RND transporter periplasmic adaptor subunit [Bdellovibrio sp.]|nr:efflux RND transporter periplasmic adaptor subunit [Bdellovibrio sp.]